MFLIFLVDPLTGDLIGKLDQSGVLARQKAQLSAPAPAKSNNITNYKMMDRDNCHCFYSLIT